MRKKIYKIHRSLSLIIALPVLLWATSGFMHPIMTNIRPRIATQAYRAPDIDRTQILISADSCLAADHLHHFNNLHIVQMGGQQFYQVLVDAQHQDIRYYSTKTGRLLKNGDELYARYLAQIFLSGQDAGQQNTAMAASDHDCCIVAAENIMNARGARIKQVTRVTGFNEEYKYINRLLPVYRVDFERADGIRIYVETAAGRFSYAADTKREAFNSFFGIFHTWEWMNALGSTKYVLMVMITLTGIITTLLGLYIFFTTSNKKSDHPVVKSRRKHRYTSLVASLFTLMFTLSGGVHAFTKLLPEAPARPVSNSFASSRARLDFTILYAALADRPFQNISLCSMNGQDYWQVWMASGKAGQADLMKSMAVAAPDVVYVNADNYTVLEKGDEQYARYLASQLSGWEPSTIRSASLVTSFTDEYGFINKRLPVWKIGYATQGNERYYVETATGALAARVTDKDLIDGYSFALLHKHHFMDWGGKMVRDISTMFWAAMQITMVVVGLMLYFRMRRRRGLR